MLKASNFPLASLVWLCVAGCTQITGLSDYNVSGESPDATMESPATTPDAESDDTDATGDAGVDATTRDIEAGVDAATASVDAHSIAVGTDGAFADMDAALDASDSAQGDEAVVEGDEAGPELDTGPICPAPNSMCGEKCVALDDPRHCGTCDHDCTALAHVSGAVSCSNGQCVVPGSACATGFAHCSSNVDDGCETDTTLPAHCGACTTACVSAAPLCAIGSGANPHHCVSDCVAPTTKCGAACVDTNTSTAHCGGCDNACPQVTRASATCGSGQCGFACNVGYHVCGTQCLANDSADSCGGSCTPCTAPANATPVCSAGGSCDFSCNAGYHRCGAQCVANSSANSCGSSCTPCGAPANATPVCSGASSCDFSCNTGYHRCGAQCVANDSANSCGSSCTPCSAPANAAPICSAATSCDFSCNASYHRCGAQCSADNSASSCGSLCTPCSAPANATASCSAAGSCDFTCNSGYHRCGSTCARDDSVSQCGGSCQVCPQIANGTAQCVSGSCGTLCDGGGSLVSGVCKPRLAAKQLAVGSDHTCAIMADNSLRCWGSNQDHLTQLKHQLGPVPTANFSRTPVQVTGLSNVTQVAAGLAHTCAVTNGSLVCWGDNQNWQLGPNSAGITSTASPVTIPVSNVLQIEAGDWETCALLSDGSVTCWGSRDGGPLVASHGASDVTEISFTGTNTCERQSGGGARCFGSNFYGAIGTSPDIMPNAVTPVAVPGLSGVTDIAQGTYNGCAVTSANGGRVWCWGTYSAVGPHQVGTTAAPPAEIPGVANARGVASGYTSTCAWTSSGAVYCWGSNAAGKLGQPTSLQETRTPMLVPNLSNVVELGIGSHHVCARTSEGWVKCWGQAVYGEVGPGTTSSFSEVPLTVPF